MGDHAIGYLRWLLPPAEEKRPAPAVKPTQQPKVTTAAPGDRPVVEPAYVPMPQSIQAPVVVAPVVELTPAGLQLRDTEREFLARLTPLLSTPRAVKKLVNLYRLLRLGVPAAELDKFVGTEQGGPFQAAALLLAELVGAPHDARDMLALLANAAPGQDILDVLNGSALGELIVEIRKEIPVHGDSETYRKWATIVARYGFETYDLFTG